MGFDGPDDDKAAGDESKGHSDDDAGDGHGGGTLVVARVDVPSVKGEGVGGVGGDGGVGAIVLEQWHSHVVAMTGVESMRRWSRVVPAAVNGAEMHERLCCCW